MATTSPTPRRDPPQQLQTLAQRLKAWRARRTPGQRIPEDLWKAAVEVARVHGLSRTATALKLAYYDLQRRVAGADMRPRRAICPTSFVQLAAPAWPVGPGEKGTVELTLGSGTRLTLRLPNAGAKDLVPLVQLVLRQR